MLEQYITYQGTAFSFKKPLCSGVLRCSGFGEHSLELAEKSLDSFHKKLQLEFENWKSIFGENKFSFADERYRTKREGCLQFLRVCDALANQFGLHFLALLPFEAAHRLEKLPTQSDLAFEFVFTEMTEKPVENFSAPQSLQYQAGKLELDLNTSSLFQNNFQKVQEHFNAGNIFEVVLSRRFEFVSKSDSDSDSDGEAEFEKLASSFVLSQNAPFRFALEFPHTRVFGMSPELLVQVVKSDKDEKWHVTNRPISGTLRRKIEGTTLRASVLSSEEDAAFVSLLNNEKEKSELDMLIDLARNDLNRVCSDVNVSKYRELLVLEKVAHTQATVTGVLREEFEPLDAVLSCLNAGTLVGAPKRKALEIIADCEKSSREYYGGQLVHCFPDGSVKATILIRTLCLKREGERSFRVAVQAGATILKESQEQEEYQECGSKALAWLEFLGFSQLAQTKPNFGISSFENILRENLVSKKWNSQKLTQNKIRPQILLLDNEDSFTFNLVAALEEFDVDVVVARPYEEPCVSKLLESCDGMVISPGPGSPKDSHFLMKYIEESYEKMPIFGVCLGHQALCESRGGRLSRMTIPLHGKSRAVFVQNDSYLLKGVPKTFFAARYHSLFVNKVPEEFQICALDAEGICLAVIAKNSRFPIASVQFHPESFLTGSVGKTILSNWLSESFRGEA